MTDTRRYLAHERRCPTCRARTGWGNPCAVGDALLTLMLLEVWPGEAARWATRPCAARAAYRRATDYPSQEEEGT